MSAYRVSLPDEEYVFEPDEILGSEWGAIEAETGGSFDEWTTGIDRRMWIPCQVLVWFLRHKDGRVEERREVDFKIRQLTVVEIPAPKVPTKRSAHGTGKSSGPVSG